MIERLIAFWNDVAARMPVELVSPLPRDEVVRRLRAAVDSEWTFAGGKSVVGHIGDDRFRLRWRIGYRNSFQTFMFGSVKSDGSGARIVARSGMHPFAAAFMALWIAAVTMLAVVAVSGVIGAPDDAAAQGVIWLVPVFMAGFGFALVWLGRWFSRNERARLIEFLQTTVGAKPAQP
jgi:hypothetical protein